jgi:hypothetical protein
MKTKLLWAFVLLSAWCAAAVVECVNVTDQGLRFTATVTGDSVDNLVGPRSSKRWSVPDESSPVSYTVEALNGATVTGLGTLAVAAERYYLVTFDGAAGLAASDRGYDAAAVQDVDPLAAARRVRWVSAGMLTMFTIEVAGIIFALLRWSRSGSSQSVES